MWESTICTAFKAHENGVTRIAPIPMPLNVTRSAFVRLLLLAAGIGPLMAAQAQAQPPIVIKFSHVVATDTPKGKAADHFARRAAELTGGKVRVEVFPNSQLYRDKEEMEALQLGAVQMLAPSLSKFAPLGVKEFEVFDLPFIFDNPQELQKVTNGPVGQALLGKLETRGITGLAYWNNGFKVMSANRPLKTVADYQGLRMRIQSSKVLGAQMRALKATPQVLAFSETYAALQNGSVDGTENPPSNLYTQRMHEVQKHVSLTYHGYLGYAVVVNKRFWDGLPKDIRAALTQAMAEATQVANESASKDNQAALVAIRASGKTQIHQPSAAERAQLKAALLTVHKEMAGRIGDETIQDIYQATGFHAPRPH